MGHICFYKSRGDGVATNIATSKLGSNRFSKTNNTCFTSCITALTCITPDTNNRTHIDDASRLCLHHRLNHLFGDVKNTLQVNIYHIIPLLFCHAKQQIIFTDTCIIYTNIYSAKFLQYIVYKSFCLCKIGSITLVSLCFYAKFLKFCFQRSRFFCTTITHISKRYRSSLFCQFQCNCFSNSSCCTSNDGNFVF